MIKFIKVIFFEEDSDISKISVINLKEAINYLFKIILIMNEANQSHFTKPLFFCSI